MLTKTITYTDYNGTERTEDFYFNLSKVEISKLAIATSGGLDKYLQNLLASNDNNAIAKFIEDFILKAYGIKTDDGRRFEKSPEISIAFQQSPAYEALWIELMTDWNAAKEFFAGMLPKELRESFENLNLGSPEEAMNYINSNTDNE